MKQALFTLMLLLALAGNAVAADCIVGGCSGQLCVEESQGGLTSTCEWTEAYGCYQTHGECKRQPGGACGWTPTKPLQDCLDEAAGD